MEHPPLSRFRRRVSHKVKAISMPAASVSLPKFAALCRTLNASFGFGALAPPVGCITPGRAKQRHVVMALGFGHGETDRHHIQKWRVGARDLGLGIIVADRKPQFISTDGNRPSRD